MRFREEFNAKVAKVAKFLGCFAKGCGYNVVYRKNPDSLCVLCDLCVGIYLYKWMTKQ
jgi:hypothetical protein